MLSDLPVNVRLILQVLVRKWEVIVILTQKLAWMCGDLKSLKINWMDFKSEGLWI